MIARWHTAPVSSTWYRAEAEVAKNWVCRKTQWCYLFQSQKRSDEMEITILLLSGFSIPHLSKGLRDMKQNGTQENSWCYSPVFMAFHMAWSFLFQVLATLWLAAIFQQPISSFYSILFLTLSSNTWSHFKFHEGHLIWWNQCVSLKYGIKQIVPSSIHSLFVPTVKEWTSPYHSHSS